MQSLNILLLFLVAPSSIHCNTTTITSNSVEYADKSLVTLMRRLTSNSGINTPRSCLPIHGIICIHCKTRIQLITNILIHYYFYIIFFTQLFVFFYQAKTNMWSCIKLQWHIFYYHRWSYNNISESIVINFSFKLSPKTLILISFIFPTVFR